MERRRAPSRPGPALVRAALVAAVVAAGPGVSAWGVTRSMRYRARPYLLGSVAARAGTGLEPRPAAPLRPDVPPPALPAVVRQSRPQSCGPAALATLLAWEGRPVGEGAVLSRARLRPDGVSLAELARLATVFGMPAGWYAVPPSDLPRLPTPLIAHLRAGGGHYVAVARIARGFVLLADPAAGLAVERLTRFRRAWSGRVMLLGGVGGGQ